MPPQSLQLSQQQRQIMSISPQQQQSLEILELPVMDLRALIQKEMEQNPAIEDVVDPAEKHIEEVVHAAPAQAVGGTPEPARAEPVGEGPAGDGEADPDDRDIAALGRLDEDWDGYFTQGMEDAGDPADRQARREFWLNSIVAPVSLYDTLEAQLDLAELGPKERQLAEIILMNLDADGYFRADLPGLAEAAGLPPEQAEAVLRTVQSLEPAGIAARDLREALLLQLARAEDTAEAALARELVDNHLHDLAARKTKALAATLGVTPDVLAEAFARIQRLDPRPGSKIGAPGAEYIEPEVTVVRRGGRWEIELDDGRLPRIRISRHYRRLLEDPAVDAETKSYIRKRVRAGLELQRSLFHRQRTITRIAAEIVAAQQAFFDHGPSRLRPMIMGEIAGRVGTHETTVSRAVANKHIRTPRGIFELKYFFTPAVRTESGEVLSNRAVQERIAAMIAAEDPAKPLSDNDLHDLLRAEGIPFARRTVTKYRRLLKVPPSAMRRQEPQ